MQPEKRPLNILIAGAGLGGLAAAYCLARDGHQVQLYEKRPVFKPKGGSIMVRPNASRFLIEWGLETDMDAVTDRATANSYRSGLNGGLIMRRPPVTAGSTPDWGCSRKDTQAILYKRAGEAGAQIHLGVSIVDIAEDESSATAKLDNGEGVTADLIIAADGILSQLRSNILGDAPSPKLGWSCLHQIGLSESELATDPDAKRMAETDDLQVFMVSGGGPYLVARYSKKLRFFNAAFGIPEVDDADPKLYEEKGDLEYVRKHFENFDPSTRAVLKLARSCDRWHLTEMPDLPRWTSKQGRLLLLGDSAHAMFPDAAQGFSQIVEDIATLSYLLSNHDQLGISAITKIWQEVRIPRVNRIKAWARFNQSLYSKGIGAGAGGAKQPTEESDLDKVKPDMNADFRSAPFVRWAFGYDAVDEVKKYVDGKEVAGVNLA